MSTVDAALAAMDTAEQEAHDHLDGDDPQDVEYGEWASDRLRLIQRDRATLKLHRSYANRFGRSVLHYCLGCKDRWPCRPAQDILDYWTQEDA